MLRKTALALVLALAVLMAAEPMLHQHPLTTRFAPSERCVICAAGVQRLPNAAPTIAAPHAVVCAFVALIAVALPNDVAGTFSSRAPPAA